MTEKEKEAAQLEKRSEARKQLRTRHSQRVVGLMDRREDLRGVHPLADLVAESVRWSA